MSFFIFKQAIKSARGLNRRDFCGATATAAKHESVAEDGDIRTTTSAGGYGDSANYPLRPL